MNRRKVLRYGGVGLIASIAGCSDILNSSENSDGGNSDGENSSENSDGEDLSENFEYPDGFTEDGFTSFEEALGEESIFYNVTSFEVGNEVTFNTTGSDRDSLVRTTHNQVNTDQQRQLISVEDSIKQTILRTDNGGYFQIEEGEEETYDYDESFVYDKPEAFSLTFLQNHLGNLNFSDSTVTEDNTVIYTADVTEDNDSATIQETYSLVSGNISVEINSDGYPINIEIDIVREQEADRDGDVEVEETYQIEYTNFNSTTIEDPDWLDEIVVHEGVPEP